MIGSFLFVPLTEQFLTRSLGYTQKKGTDCIQLAPFGCVTSTGQISMYFMKD